MTSTLPLRPFFSYYGSKWRIAKRYPIPAHPTIIEPFAGSAGYSLHYPDRQVHLYDLSEYVVSVWDYLIHVTPEEIRQLPLDLPPTIDLLTDIPQEARWLLGFWINKGCDTPRHTPSPWYNHWRLTKPGSIWSGRIRERIASQIQYIRHWTVDRIHYAEIDPAGYASATWFVDPPYDMQAGTHYPHSLSVDYGELATWCRRLTGQVIVCESSSATWLPFTPIGTSHAGAHAIRAGRISGITEAVWTRNT